MSANPLAAPARQEQTLRPIAELDPATLAPVRFVLTDMDETLTWRGRLSAATYTALERLQAAGIRVIPVTAAPAGWCDQMARMWPVDGVIGENGGLYFHRQADGHDGIALSFWHHATGARAEADAKLRLAAEAVARALPAIRPAADQPFRLTSLAYSDPGPALRGPLIETLRAAGLQVTLNNLWVLGWVGAYDKLAAARRVLASHYGLDIDADREAVLYTGDSTNDGPMFAFFRHTVGVSTVLDYRDRLVALPRWITRGPGGSGFVEAAEAVLASREAR